VAVGRKVWVTFLKREKLAPYLRAVEKAGLEPLAVSPADGDGFSECGGLLLTGGGDVNPALYGETPHGKTAGIDEARDRLEMALLGRALELDLPVLAICRGMQLLNVYLGGTLIQHIPGHSMPRRLEAHAVEIVPRTKLGVLAGTKELAVNSRHHQAAGAIGAGLLVSAKSSKDGIVEGLELPDRRFVVGVQWHPEDRVEAYAADRCLFEAFAAAVNYKP